MSSGSAHLDSGLLHQRQCRGHDFRKTIVRMPGPSCTLKRWMSKTFPYIASTISDRSEGCTDEIALSFMFRSPDDFVLNFLVEFDKVSAVSGHSHHQAAKLFRVFLRLPQGFTRDHIELNMPDTKIDKAS